MKRLFLLFLSILSICKVDAGLIQHQIDAIPAKAFVKQSLFSEQKISLATTLNLKDIISTYDLLNVYEETLKNIASTQPNSIELNLPIDGVWETLLLTRNQVVNDHTIFTSQNNVENKMLNYKGGAYYYGVLKNKINTIAAISFFENDIIGVVSTDQGNYVVGRSNIKDFTSKEYIVYNDKNLLIASNISCGSGENFILQRLANSMTETITETITTKCVKVYIVCDYKFFLDHGSTVTSATNFATGLFNMTHTLYLNDSIATAISQIDIWTTTDPYYTLSSSSAMLNAFGTDVSIGFNGDIAHLFSNRNVGGGIAWVNVLCDIPEFRTAVSASLGNSLTSLPTYSWNANVVTHEIGHNIGSSHTHSCVWNGNNTRIDNCGGHAGYPSGTCADIVPDPAGGGTIMSYCHLVSGVGINFNFGFGPLPGALIRAKVNGSSCLTTCITCASNLTISNIYSTPLTESSTWIKSSGQTTILNSSNVKLDADNANGYVLLQPSTSTDFFLSTPDNTHFFVAQPYDGCGGLQPARIANTNSDDEIKKSSFVLYPNPAHDKISVRFEKEINEIFKYEILTFDGKSIQVNQSVFLPQNFDIDISPFHPGLYLLKIYGNNEIEVVKFQKE